METRTKFVVVVLVSALIVAFESVVVEGALKIADIDIFLVSSVPLISGGMILIALAKETVPNFSKVLGRRGWTWMTLLCALSAAGAFMWFDAVGRIGASKEAILGGGSSEVLFVVILSAVFLKERLRRIEVLGSLLVIIGVFVVLANAESVSLSVGDGEIEAIVSSLMLGTSIVIATYLLHTSDLTVFSGVQLVYSGGIVLALSFAAGTTLPDLGGWALLIVMGCMPAIGLWTYNAGLPKIGASLTSVLFALSGVMTVGVQLLVLLFFPDAEIQLPQSIALAVAGGVIAFAGVYLLNSGRNGNKDVVARP